MDANLRTQFVMVTREEGSSPILFEDLKYDNRTIVLNGFSIKPYNAAINMIKRIHLSEKINKYIHLPFKNIWCSLKTLKWDRNTEYYIIFVGSAMRRGSLNYLKQLREKYNVKYILYMLDALSDTKSSKIAKYYIKNLGFDYILTFDSNDAEENGYIYVEAPYSIIDEDFYYNVENDICLIANAKGRLLKFYDIYEYLTKNNVRCQYRISGVPKKQKRFKNIVYNKLISYREIIKELKKSNCILEVLIKGQTAATNRFYEAICYNKKLLTNNKNAVNLPFYNPEYIHIFENPEDIDCEWVKERIPIDYGYDGRFSSIHLIDKIIELEKQKEGQADG